MSRSRDFPRVARAVVAGVVLGAGVAEPVLARIKLITLPARERVEIHLEREGSTLVEEERIVPLLAGDNLVDFSWSGAPVEPSSIVFRVLPEPGAGPRTVNVLAVSYPPGENALVWTVSTDRAGPARVRISYLMERLDRTFSYRAVVDSDERAMVLSRHVRVSNLTGESFGETGLLLGNAERIDRPLEVNETREVLVERVAGVPVRKTYTVDPDAVGYLDPVENKLRVAMRYVVENEGGGLGRIPLPRGKVRIFQADGRGGSAFLGEDWGDYTAPGERMELDIGVARDVTVRRVIESNESRRVDGDLQRREVVVRYEIENFKDQPVTLHLVELPAGVIGQVLGPLRRDAEWHLGDRTTFSAPPDPEQTTAERIVLRAELPAAVDGKADKIVHRAHIVFANEW